MAGIGILQFTGLTANNFKDFRVHSTPKGMTTSFRVTSPVIENLVAYHNYVVLHGADVEFTGVDGGETRELSVSVPGLVDITTGVLSELFFDQWELLTNESSDTIFADPRILATLNYNDKMVLSRLARDGGTITDAVSSCNTDITSGGLTAPTEANGGTADGKFQAPSAAASQQLALEILKGQTEYETPTYVLRHTSYCSAGAYYNAAISGAQLIYSPSQLLSEVGYGWVYNLPPRLYSKIASIPVQFTDSDEAAYYTWGWLKKITRETVLANFMVEISTEYELALWSNLRYGLL